VTDPRRYDEAYWGIGTEEVDPLDQPPPDAASSRRIRSEPVASMDGGHKRPRWLGYALIIVVVGLILGVVTIVWARGQINPGGKLGAQVTVAIPKGSSTAKVASLLGSKGVIHSPTIFRFYVKLKGAGPLLAGTYNFQKNSKYDTVISLLRKGPIVQEHHLTIPEGFTLTQIADRVGKLPGLSAQKFLDLATNGQVRSPYQPPGVNSLEGLLYPATYNIKPGEDETSIIQRMLDAFDQQMQTVTVDPALTRMGITQYQVAIVASIIEREGKLAEDRGPIASVIYNRLKKGMKLQLDSTGLYGQHATDPHQLDLKYDSPYNTYLYKGLPPTPMASPGMAALQAAAQPPTTTYLYYILIDPNGKQAFASTSKEFDRLHAEAKAKGLL
jgi:UPF0755 protein